MCVLPTLLTQYKNGLYCDIWGNILLGYLGQYYTHSQLIIWTLKRHGHNIQKVKIIPALYQCQYKAQYLYWKIKGRSFIFTITMHVSHVLKLLYSDSFVHFGGKPLKGTIVICFIILIQKENTLNFYLFLFSCWMCFKLLFYKLLIYHKHVSAS